MIMFIYETLQSVFNFCLLFIVTYLYSIYHKIWFMIIFILNLLQKAKGQFFFFVCVFVSKKIVKIYFFKLKFRLFTQKKKTKKNYYYKENPKLTLSIYSHTSLYPINTHDSIMKMLWSITSQKKRKSNCLKKKKKNKKKNHNNKPRSIHLGQEKD